MSASRSSTCRKSKRSKAHTARRCRGALQQCEETVMRYAGLLLALLPLVAWAQAPQTGWKPDRAVELIVGAAPGGANDRIGRSIQRILQETKLANPVNVVNKPGGGQAIAFAYLNSHPANPHY